MQDITITIPFEYKPAGLPDWATGYTGQGRNGAFKAAGVVLEQHSGPVTRMDQVDLANLTSRGNQANQAVTMPPEVMDQLAVRWLSLRGYHEVIAAGIRGRTVESLLPLEAIDSDSAQQRAVEAGAVGIVVIAGYEKGIFDAVVNFGDRFVVVPVRDLFDPKKWRYHPV